MSSHAASGGSWSVAGNYQPQYHSFTFESEEIYHLQISLHQAEPSRPSTADDNRRPAVTTGGGSDDFHCTHSQGEEHCILHSGEYTRPTRQVVLDHDQLFSLSPAMKRYLHEHQRHERVAVDCSNLTQDTTEQDRENPLLASRSHLSGSGEDTHGPTKEEAQVQDTGN